MEEVMTYLHKALGSPKISTLLMAVENNNLTTWPSLSTRDITKYVTKSVETGLGHLDQERKKKFHKEHNTKTRKGKIRKNYHTTRRRKNLHRSDRAIPNYIKQRIHVHSHTA